MDQDTTVQVFGFAAGSRRVGVADFFHGMGEGRCSRRHNFPCFPFGIGVGKVVSPQQCTPL